MKAWWMCLLCLTLLVQGCAAPAAQPAPVVPTPTLAPGQEWIEDVSLTDGINLSGTWKMAKPAAFREEMTQPAFDDAAWSAVQAPSGWDQQNLAGEIGKGTVVIYRRQVQVPATWKGQRLGISAWFNPFAARVFVNGQQVEPVRKPYAAYGEVTSLIRPGETNTVAVVVQYDGWLEMKDAGPARLGPIGQRTVTHIQQDAVKVNLGSAQADAALVYPAGGTSLPALVLVATGSHSMGELSNWLDFAQEFARRGVVCLAVALPTQTAAGVKAAIETVRGQPQVNPAQVTLFGVDLSAQAVVQAAAADAQVRGVILLSAPLVEETAQLVNRPLLLLSSQGDRKGFYLEQAQEMARLAGARAQVVSLPGDGHGTFVLNNTWNAVTGAVDHWLTK